MPSNCPSQFKCCIHSNKISFIFVILPTFTLIEDVCFCALSLSFYVYQCCIIIFSSSLTVQISIWAFPQLFNFNFSISWEIWTRLAPMKSIITSCFPGIETHFSQPIFEPHIKLSDIRDSMHVFQEVILRWWLFTLHLRCLQSLLVNGAQTDLDHGSLPS